MNIAKVSFGAGLIKYKDKYINPDNIVKFEPWSRNETIVAYSNNVESGGVGSSPYKVLKISVDKFAEAFIKAQKTESVVDLKV